MTDEEVARLLKAREDALAGCPISNVPVGELPREEGTAAAPAPSAAELRTLPHIHKIRFAHRLSEVQQDYAFFTHGLLFTHGGFQHDPVEEWMLLNDCPGAVFALEFVQPLFVGLGIPDPVHAQHYNHLLMGCERGVWEKLYRYLNTIIAADPVKKAYVTTFVHEARMPDPKAWKPGDGHPNPASVIPVHPVGLSANFGLYYMDSFKEFLPPPHYRKVGPQKLATNYLPRLRTDAAEDKVLKMADALFGGKR
jgi:hypothetical protein